MKLQKNNKYKGKIALGLATIMLSGIIMSGCNNVNGSTIIIEEPVATVEITSTPMPTPTPIPTTALSHEEMIALLNISNPDEIVSLSSLNVIEYSVDHQDKIMFAFINAIPNKNGGYDVHELFTSKILFSLNYDIMGKKASYDLTNITIKNYTLKFAYLKNAFAIYDFADSSTILKGGAIKSNDYFDIIHPNDINEFKNTQMTLSEAAEMYLSFIPENNRVSAEEIGAVDKEKVLVK